MRSKRLLAGALAGVTTLTVLGGCAQQQLEALEPKLELREAARHLGDAQQAGFTLTLTGTADDLIAATGTRRKDDVKALRAVFNSTVTLAYDKAGEGPDDDRSGLAATIDGVSGSELRYVDGTLFVKAPVAELAARFGAKPAEVAALRREAVAEMPSAKALFDGGWVSVDVRELSDLATGYALGTTPSEEALQQQKLLTEFTASATNLLDGADVVRDSADSRHLIVTSSTAQAFAEAKRLATAVEPALAEDFGAAPADQPVVIDLWVDGGRLTAAEIDVLQFVEGATGRVAARIEVTTGAPITAPDDAVRLDLSAGLNGAFASAPV